MTERTQPSAPRVLVNGCHGNCVEARDRGLALGDGLFETMAVRAGRIRFRERHLARFERGCRTLDIPAPDAGILAGELDRMLEPGDDGTLRLTVTRGPGPRGYAPPPEPTPTRILAYHPGIPAFPDRPLQLRWCAMRLAVQPRLAGIKHLNRLEQVLARAEWNDPCIDEGVMQSTDGRLIECTMANLFLVHGQSLITPALHDCGVAGVMRDVVLDAAADRGIDVQVRDVPPSELAAADEVFVTNAARGVAAVGAVAERSYPAPGSLTRVLADTIDWTDGAWRNGV